MRKFSLPFPGSLHLPRPLHAVPSLTRRALLILLGWLALSTATHAAIVESFDTDPTTHGWERFGDSNLFRWSPASPGLGVTWDSSRSNSYFRLPLGTVLTRRDAFSASVDLTMQDIAAGVDPDLPGTFQIAFGFQNRATADDPAFIRGTGSDSPDLVEFNFFPDTGFGPTVWPAVTGDNGAMNYGGIGDFSLYELPVGVRMRIDLTFDPSIPGLSVSITTNGIAVGPVTTARLTQTFGEFQIDAFAIASYGGQGQGSFMPGSILAHARVDRIEVEIPPPPIAEFRGGFVPGSGWTCRFVGRAGWRYQLEASSDLHRWESVGEPIEGTGGLQEVRDRPVPPEAAHRFYRLNASPLPR